MIKKISVLGGLAVLAACDTSSTTGGSAATEISGVNYTGTGTVRVEGDGLDVSYTEDVAITVNNEDVRVEVDVFSGIGPRNGNRFTVTIDADEELDGYACEGTLIFNGVIDGDTINGTIGGENNCEFLGFDIISADNTGTFSATAN